MIIILYCSLNSTEQNMCNQPLTGITFPRDAAGAGHRSIYLYFKINEIWLLQLLLSLDEGGSSPGRAGRSRPQPALPLALALNIRQGREKSPGLPNTTFGIFAKTLTSPQLATICSCSFGCFQFLTPSGISCASLTKVFVTVGLLFCRV